MHVTREPAAAPCCRDAVAEALASVRAEGLEPSSTGLSLCEAIARGELDPEQAVARLTAHYRPHARSPRPA
ncbi:antitoxin VbhA family protein [Pseudonocardia sp. RS010]|uniref:antitoxin VbhA family protein n=1 Tax=Pseudonocardia sp. RS010 TaxID=3385979 RepID=UPI0039A1DC18